VYGLYRGIVDRLCTRGIVAASEIVELLPVGLHAESPVGDGHRGVLAGTIKAPSHP